MIQDIYPKIYHNEYRDINPSQNDCILIFHKNKVLIRFQEDKLRYPTLQEFKDHAKTSVSFKADKYIFYYLFSIDDRKYFLAYPDSTALILQELPPVSLPGYAYEDVRIFRTAKSRHTSFAGITAHHLYGWYQTNRFCGRCDHPMSADHRERMLFCPQCHNMVYPRISPAVIVGILNGDKILMSKYAGRSYANYALIAGYVEVGENVEQTVQREVMEEVGLKVKNIRYYKSQPWAFSGSLLMGFFCDLDGSDQITLDTGELAEAGWFSREEISLADDSVSLTREMIIRFKEGRERAL